MTVELTGPPAAMECAELERALDAYLDGELDGAERADAEAHLQGCERCRARLQARARVRRAVKRCLQEAMGRGSGLAPPELRLRIVRALERERRPWRPHLPRRLPAVVLGVLAAFAIAAAALLPRADPLAHEAVLRHARDLPLEVGGAEPVAAWFEGKLDFNPRPPLFAAADVRMLGARLSHIGDRPAAYIRYQLPHGRVGLFILEDRERRFGESGRAVLVGPDVVRLADARGYHLATWRRGELVYSLVGDVDEEQLTALVRSAAHR